MMRTALKYQPGNQRYSLRLGEILSRQGKLDESEAIAQKIYHASDITADSKVRARIKQLQESGYGNYPVCVAKIADFSASLTVSCCCCEATSCSRSLSSVWSRPNTTTAL